jgi:hypothetical protein
MHPYLQVVGIFTNSLPHSLFESYQASRAIKSHTQLTSLRGGVDVKEFVNGIIADFVKPN